MCYCLVCIVPQDGKARKVVSCSCVVVKAWGEESEAKKMILEQIKNQA